MKTISRMILEVMSPDFKKWRKANVSYRGSDNYDPTEGNSEGRGGVLGNGLYSTPLSNKAMTKGYSSKTHILVGAIPRKPLIVKSVNAWEIWLQNLIVKVLGGGYPDRREFDKNHTIEDEVQKLGYDGVIITGREMVVYKPNKNIRTFETERQLEHWYDDFHDGETGPVDLGNTY